MKNKKDINSIEKVEKKSIGLAIMRKMDLCKRKRDSHLRSFEMFDERYRELMFELNDFLEGQGV